MVDSLGMARPKPPLVVIGTPTRGGCHPDFVLSLLDTHQLFASHGIGVFWLPLTGDSLVPRARNEIAAMALANPEATHILWIDDDIGWQPEDALRLLMHEADVVVGLCPRRDGRERPPVERFVFNPLDTGSNEAPIDPRTGLLEVAAGGTGFMLTTRTVFERLAEAYPESRIQASDDPDDDILNAALPWLHDYFPLYVEHGRYLSEDYTFCHRWRALGGKVLADLTIQLRHYGQTIYTGDPMSMFDLVRKSAA